MFAFGAKVPMLDQGIHQHFQATQEFQIGYNFQDFLRNLYQIVLKQRDSINGIKNIVIFRYVLEEINYNQQNENRGKEIIIFPVSANFDGHTKGEH